MLPFLWMQLIIVNIIYIHKTPFFCCVSFLLLNRRHEKMYVGESVNDMEMVVVVDDKKIKIKWGKVDGDKANSFFV